jgi:arginine decarboxylase
MKTGASSPARVDRLFSTGEARLDRWYQLTLAAQGWAARKDKGGRGATEAAYAELRAAESFFGYPGPRLLRAVEDEIAQGDGGDVARLVQRIYAALLSNSYRGDAADWETTTDATEGGAGRLPPRLESGDTRRPYFELLIVSPASPARWPTVTQELRRLRRPEDQFIYEGVVVGSFEDAVLAIMFNGAIQAVVIHDGFPFASRYDAPVLRELLTAHVSLGAGEAAPQEYGTQLARAVKRIRPELDIYLLSRRNVDKVAADPAVAASVRRVFYGVEEPLEIHLSAIEGVAERFETPYFDNLKKYAQRPIGTFHALPVARGKSIFKSNWIRDMGEFYGPTLFLAESSATTGGLDSLLEPTGTIKRAQDLAARAFGCDRVFFVTNGTSTSNKMVEQALLGPGDIAIVDRNCHKSHHYGMVMAGAQPYYVEAYPMTAYSMYGGVPLKSLKKALLEIKAAGRLDRVRLVTLTNCTFDGHVYNVRRVMEELLAIKPDLIFLWDEAWFGFARYSPFLRPRTAMGAAADLEAYLKTPAAATAAAAQARALGKDLDPKDPRVLERRLVPDPAKVRLRVYQTNSTHKSMSSLRQGSMVLVRDVDFHHVEAQFKEAVFTHASTSPNLQIIATLDVARRQMELEGYELVARSTQLALDIRRAVNSHPLISKYFRVLDVADMIPAEYRPSGFASFLKAGQTWLDAVKALREDEFWLDPTRLTLVCGTAGFDGTQFKGLLASKYEIQLNKTSRNSVLFQTNINNTLSDVAHLVKVLAEIAGELDEQLTHGTDADRAAFKARVKALMEDVPDLPNFTRFHDSFREHPGGKTIEGDMRGGFYAAYNEAGCEYLALNSPEIDARLKKGPELVSANFVIPYPPGFPIMVPGQVLDAGTIGFMRKLDVKEIHGFNASRGLKLLKPSALGDAKRATPAPARARGRKRR